MVMGHFTNRKHQPTAEEIRLALGSRYPLWERLTRFIEAREQIQSKWSFWGPAKSGWNLRYQRKGRALVALYPQQERITVQVVLGKAQAERACRLELLLEYGVNHIDTAPMYGNAEQRIGPWMEAHGSDFFIGTKTRSRTYRGAWDDLRRSLERLRIDAVDLWQIHGLTGPKNWETAMGPGGALEAFIEARDKGLVRFLGVTGHGLKAPAMHARSLERFDFDAVMLPYNHSLMGKRRYAADWEALISRCRQDQVAVQTIKSIARRPWKGHPRTYNTFFYEPLDTRGAVAPAVHWALGCPDVFVITAGDMRVLPSMLEVAECYEARPSDADMATHTARWAIEPMYR